MVKLAQRCPDVFVLVASRLHLADDEPEVPDFIFVRPNTNNFPSSSGTLKFYQLTYFPASPSMNEVFAHVDNYLQAHKIIEMRLTKTKRWEIVKPLAERIKAMQRKIDSSISHYMHQEQVFNMRCGEENVHR